MGRGVACLLAGGREGLVTGDQPSCDCMRTLVEVIDIVRAKMAWGRLLLAGLCYCRDNFPAFYCMSHVDLCRYIDRTSSFMIKIRLLS